jgi:hypothetical protein
METKIINYESSCFVIGRSGTGETLLPSYYGMSPELAIRPRLPQAKLRRKRITYAIGFLEPLPPENCLIRYLRAQNVIQAPRG